MFESSQTNKKQKKIEVTQTMNKHINSTRTLNLSGTDLRFKLEPTETVDYIEYNGTFHRLFQDNYFLIL